MGGTGQPPCWFMNSGKWRFLIWYLAYLLGYYSLPTALMRYTSHQSRTMLHEIENVGWSVFLWIRFHNFIECWLWIVDCGLTIPFPPMFSYCSNCLVAKLDSLVHWFTESLLAPASRWTHQKIYNIFEFPSFSFSSSSISSTSFSALHSHSSFVSTSTQSLNPFFSPNFRPTQPKCSSPTFSPSPCFLPAAL